MSPSNASICINMWIRKDFTTMLVIKRSAGVTPEVNLKNPLHAGDKACKLRDPPWLWNAGQMSPEVQKGASMNPQKDRCLRKYIFLKIVPSWCKVSSKIQASFTTAVYVSCVLMVRMMMYVLSWKAFCQIGSKQRIKFVTIISKQEPAMSSEVHCYHRCVPKVKIVKNPLLFLHQCTFTMHRPRVYSANQWWSQQQRQRGCTSWAIHCIASF